MHTKRTIFVLVFAALISVSLLYVSFFLPTTPSCGERIGLARVTRSNLSNLHFGAITKFRLPGNSFPNGIAASSDGSVWFGEQNVPGVAHLYPNGTILEFAWPIKYSPSTTSIWGVALWNGRIWASDALGSQIVSMDPSTATIYAVKLNEPGAFPYTITVGPDDALWFTELFVSRLGRIDTQCKVEEFNAPLNFGGTPTQIGFANSTSGYYLDAGNTTSGLGTLLSFNTKQFSPQPTHGAFNLKAPSGLALVDGGVWVTQHGASTLAFYDFNRREWSLFPTSPVRYETTTLPYFVAANGSLIWFNEHYANRLAKLDAARGFLTEYSLSEPPASRITDIGNALTFALGKEKVWFAELTANYVGYVDASYEPNFTISEGSNSNIKLILGNRVNVTFTVSGQSSRPLTVQFADTENFTSRPQRIIINANKTEIQTLDGQKTIAVTIEANKTLPAGNYTLLVTVSDGLINQGAYLKIQITT